MGMAECASIPGGLSQAHFSNGQVLICRVFWDKKTRHVGEGGWSCGGCSVWLVNREGGAVHPAPPSAAAAPQAVQDWPAHTSQAAAVCPEAGALGCSDLGEI